MKTGTYSSPGSHIDIYKETVVVGSEKIKELLAREEFCFWESLSQVQLQRFMTLPSSCMPENNSRILIWQTKKIEKIKMDR